MNKYLIGVDYAKEIEAIDEDEAMQIFFEDLAQSNDCLDNHIFINKIK